jgi:hypothetical protein
VNQSRDGNRQPNNDWAWRRDRRLQLGKRWSLLDICACAGSASKARRSLLDGLLGLLRAALCSWFIAVYTCSTERGSQQRQECCRSGCWLFIFLGCALSLAAIALGGTLLPSNA